MRYVIKGDQYVKGFERDYYFLFTNDINEAKQFGSIMEIIQVFCRRAVAHSGFTTDYTIVGIKEVSTPRYEEVIL